MIRHLLSMLELAGVSRARMVLLVGTALFVGAVNVGLVSLLGETVRRGGSSQMLRDLAIFVAGSVAFLLLSMWVQSEVVRVNEGALRTIRNRFARTLLAAALPDIESVAHHIKHAALARDAMIVASVVPGLVGIASSAAAVLGGLGYLFVLAPKAAALFCAVIGAGIVLYQWGMQRLTPGQRNAHALADRYFSFAEDMLRGSKELKLDAVMAERFLRDDLGRALDDATAALTRVRSRQQTVGLVGIVVFFMLIGGSVFASSIYGTADPRLVTSFLLTLLFLNAPIQNAVLRVPMVLESFIATERIRGTLARLKAEPPAPPGPPATVPEGWSRLRLDNVSFHYDAPDGTPGFALHAIDLEARRGDIVFIIGGNGSGKTTLAKILTGLYAPSTGRLLVDDLPASARLGAYRSLFNAVFSDSHLFAHDLDALPPQQRDRFDALCRDLAIQPGRRADGRLDTVALSAGQRKRLALALALCEDKPVQLFDEWTADQDPEFRAYFYQRFLPRLRAEKRTVFVISHDDRWFHTADLLVRLDAGRIVSVERLSAARPAGSALTFPQDQLEDSL